MPWYKNNMLYPHIILDNNIDSKVVHKPFFLLFEWGVKQITS